MGTRGSGRFGLPMGALVGAPAWGRGVHCGLGRIGETNPGRVVSIAQEEVGERAIDERCRAWRTSSSPSFQVRLNNYQNWPGAGGHTNTRGRGAAVSGAPEVWSAVLPDIRIQGEWRRIGACRRVSDSELRVGTDTAGSCWSALTISQ